MSRLEVRIEGQTLTIRNIKTRVREQDSEIVDLLLLEENKKYQSTVPVTKKKDSNKILFFEPVVGVENIDGEEMYVMVYLQEQKIFYAIGKPEILLKKIVLFKNKVLRCKMNKQYLTIWMAGYFIQEFDKVQISNQGLDVGENITINTDYNIYSQKIRLRKLIFKWPIRKIKVSLDSVLEHAESIDTNIRMGIDVMGYRVQFGLAYRKRGVNLSREYFAPVASVMRDDMTLFVRRNNRGVIVLVNRLQDAYEKTSRYRFWESKLVSGFLYKWENFVKKHSKEIVNVYFEKETMKAEEGTLEVCMLANEKGKSKNYFIIDENSVDYERIKDIEGVVKKYTPKYYKLVYRANHFIASEAPAHVNILRSANRYIRLTCVTTPFVFLQHGITYMKRHATTSAFVKNKEAEPSYMFVGSEKERDVVVEMLDIPEEDVLITGLPIFDTIEYSHIKQDSSDYATIMLTFKPYEETLDDFENSRYYNSILRLYDILQKYLPEEKIRIVAHPRIHYLLETTSLKDRMWDKPISEVLEDTKLLITDYSSVAYNSFYQGAGVVFFQEDLEEYESICGELIPLEEEFIGPRVFDLETFDQIMEKTIVDGKINLDVIRTKQNIEAYESINEFHDGKNVKRIVKELLHLGII